MIKQAILSGVVSGITMITGGVSLVGSNIMNSAQICGFNAHIPPLQVMLELWSSVADQEDWGLWVSSQMKWIVCSGLDSQTLQVADQE